MIQSINKQLNSIDIAISKLTSVLEGKSKFAETEWAREQMRAITMDLQELITIRNSLLKTKNNIDVGEQKNQ